LGKAQRHQALTIFVLAIVVTLLSAAASSLTQSVSLFTGIYWAVTTATAVGYGDVTPKNTVGKVIAAAVMLTSIPLFASLFAVLAAHVTAQQIRKIMGLDKKEPRDGFTLLIGSSPLLRQTIEELYKAGRRCVIVPGDHGGAEYEDMQEYIHVIDGSSAEEATIRKAHPERAEQILIASDKDTDVLLASVITKHLAPEVPVVAVAKSKQVAAAISDLVSLLRSLRRNNRL
jgi:voltage-gated potassium channel